MLQSWHDSLYELDSFVQKWIIVTVVHKLTNLDVFELRILPKVFGVLLLSMQLEAQLGISQKLKKMSKSR